MASVNYTAIPSLADFHRSGARVRVVRGPIGSGKTTAMLIELLRMACEQAPDPDTGKRHTQMAVIRNTLPQLKSTCLVSIMQFLQPIAHWRPSDSTVQIRFGDVESDWLLLPMDTPENIRKLLSLELTAAWVSEAREIDPEIVRNVLSRCGRFPARARGGATRYGLIMESNSFSMDSPWYELLEEELPDNWDYFVQPSAIGGQADWLQYLPTDYYTDLMESNTPEWVHQYVENEYGPSLAGEAVFKNTFSTNFHVAENRLIPTPTQQLMIGFDFARHPAAVFCQIDPRGRFLVLDELEKENIGVEAFAREYVLPLLRSDKYRSCPSIIIGDPSGVSRSQIGEESVFDALKRLGFHAFPASTNQIDPRIRAVEKFLIQQRDGGPGFLIDPECKVLIQAFQSKYRYKKKTDGTIDNTKPEKLRPWADVMDALEYACLGTDRRIQNFARNLFNPLPPQPVISAASWT